MTTKDKILSVIHSLSDEVSIEEAIDRLYLLRKVETGVRQADEDNVVEHEQFMKRLLDEAEED